MRKQTRLPFVRLLLFCALLVGLLPLPLPSALAAPPPRPSARQETPPRTIAAQAANTDDALLTVARQYLRDQRTRWGLSEADLADVVVTDRYVTQHNGVTHLYLRQRYLGIELFNGDINLAIDRNGQVLYSASRFVPNLAQAVNTTRPTLSASQSIGGAAAALHLQATGPLQELEKATGPAQALRLRGAGLAQSTIPAKLIYQRQPDGRVRLAWNTLLDPPTQDHVWLLNIDAVTGAILFRHDRVIHEQPARPSGAPLTQAQIVTPTITATPTANPTATATPTGLPGATPTTTPTATSTPAQARYRVVPLPLENPEDGPGLPDSHSLVTDPADGVASPFGWHDVNGEAGAEFTDTRGNNVAAQEDRDDNDSGGHRPGGANTVGTLVFDYAFAAGQAPTAGSNQDAAIVNLFYWNNIVHDLFYGYGFDEAAGNFQQNNYGRGGADADAVLADAQDGSGTDNANFLTAPDGEASRMQMFIFTETTPNRDSALDNGVIIHEYGHGISTRLTGGPSNVDCLWNDEQMGEGWSDWLALVATADASDTATQGRAMGAYLLGQDANGSGIRSYPYSTDLNVNPQTYDTIKSSVIPHGVGEVWAQMLWEVYWALVQQDGFDPDLYHGTGGNNLAIQLVIDGMKLQPCEPGFVDGRDAILAADQINNGGANQCLLWAAFAKRGLGYSADQGSAADAMDGTEAFDLPDDCLHTLTLRKTVNAMIAQPGEVLTYTLAATNYTTQTLTNVLLTDTLPAGLTYLAASAGGSVSGRIVQWPAMTLAPDDAVVHTIQAQVDGAVLATPPLFFDDLESGDQWTGTGLWHRVMDGEPCANSASPTTSWYYGQAADCTYDTGSANAGTLTLNTPITLPVGASRLQFSSWQETEPFDEYDRPLVRISTNGTDFTDLAYWADNSAAWQPITLDLSAYGGQAVWLQFALDTTDEQHNHYTGWYIDDVQIYIDHSVLNNVAFIVAAEGDTATASVETIVVAPPANDEFDNATVISGTAFQEDIETTKATVAADDPIFSCTDDTGQRTIWYAVTAPFSGLLQVDLTGPNDDLLGGIWTGSRGALTELTCAPEFAPSAATGANSGGILHLHMAVPIVVGTTYYIEAAQSQSVGLTTGSAPQRHYQEIAIELTPLPDLAVAPTALEATLLGGDQLTQTLWLSNSGYAELNFQMLELNYDTQPGADWSHLAAVQVPGYQPAAQATTGATYAGSALRARSSWSYQAKPTGLISDRPLDVLLLAAGSMTQLQAILRAYPDLATVDDFDARYLTPTLEQLLAYDVVVVTADVAFANAVALGNVLADYLDVGGALLQSVPTFYDGDGSGYGLPGRFGEEGYSPLIGAGDWFSAAALADFVPTHPIMHGVTTASDELRQMVELAPGAAWVASWEDDELIATKGRVVALNAFLADGFAWTGDIDLIVHNSLVWLTTQQRDVTPWLAVTPVTGTVAISGSQEVQVQFDTGGGKVAAAGDYHGALKILSNDRDAHGLTVPITLHVIGPELTLPHLNAYHGRALTIPLTLNTNGLAIAATAFSIDYDANCLALDPTDRDEDGLPDAVALRLPDGFQASVQYDPDDHDGELDLFFADTFPPFTTLTDGVLATLTLTPRCQPPQGTALDAAVYFSRAPLPTFGDPAGHDIPGRGMNGTLSIRHAVAGDCNHDDQVNAADTIACVLELFDNDGAYWLDAPGGDYAGNPLGCDSNQDTIIDAADLICTTLIIFNGPHACLQSAVVAAAGAATLAMPMTLSAAAGQTVAVPLSFTGGANRVAAAVFAVDIDPTRVGFDPTDSNGDAIPDAITFTVPDGFAPQVTYDAARHQLRFVVADLAPPLALLPDGLVATVTLTVLSTADGAAPSTIPLTFAVDQPASLGSDQGQPVALTTSNGAVTLSRDESNGGQSNKLYMPLITK